MSRWNVAFESQQAIEKIQKLLAVLVQANTEKFSADEKADGWILPCVALPTSDLTVDQVDFLEIPNPADIKPGPGRGF